MWSKLSSIARARLTLVSTLLLGSLVGGALVRYGHALWAPAATGHVYSRPESGLATPVGPEKALADAPEAPPALTERERAVLKRLASLPDLPIVEVPAFDVKVSAPEAPIGSAAKEAHDVPATASSGAAVIARIQLVRVGQGRVFYLSVDDQLHTARAGERLLGVNGRVVSVDALGADLQIDGQHVRVRADML